LEILENKTLKEGMKVLKYNKNIIKKQCFKLKKYY